MTTAVKTEELTGLSRFGRMTLAPLALIVLCPPTAMLMWHTMVELDGSVLALFAEIADQGLFTTLAAVWGPVFLGTPTAWKILGIFAALQLAFMRLVPGPPFLGPVTPTGNVPEYKANGFPTFLLTMGLFALATGPLDLFRASIVYDHFHGILGALNAFSLLFCLGLYLKGRFAPSTSDHSVTGNFVFDYYWGTELYPRVLGWDVKMFTNCRFGMMAWPLLLVSFAAAQAEAHGLSNSMMVGVGLQLVYIAKFFWWETGYLRSLDIMHDRAGFYICWGCLVWVPAVYTSPTLYLVGHPHHLAWPLAAAIFALGVAAIFVNYAADRQRQRVRATGGQTRVWGREPVLIKARYTTEQGEAKENLLLASGWWGISRHFHYVPELAAAFLWTVPALFDHFLPYFYVIFLAILLTERAFRDDRRCARKYGEDWDRYCEQVPYKILPGIV